MEQCATEMVCPPPTIGWSALILWTITVYGVLGILSIFTTCVHWREPSKTGARILGVLTILDLVTAALAPLVIYVVMGAPRAAAAVTVVWMALAAICEIASQRPMHQLPRARLLR